MTTEIDFSIAELSRLLQNLIRFGTVKEIDLETARVRVEIGELLTNWLPWLTLRAGADKTWWSPSLDEQVLVLSPGGDFAQAVCLPAVYSDANPANGNSDTIHRTSYSDGAVIEYDKENHVLTVTLPEGGEVNITADVNVTGNITASGDITDKLKSMQDDRDVYNGHTHIETDSETEVPTQQNT